MAAPKPAPQKPRPKALPPPRVQREHVCAQCGGPHDDDDVIHLMSHADGGHGFVHDACREDYLTAQRESAAAATELVEEEDVGGDLVDEIPAAPAAHGRARQKTKNRR